MRMSLFAGRVTVPRTMVVPRCIWPCTSVISFIPFQRRGFLSVPSAQREPRTEWKRQMRIIQTLSSFIWPSSNNNNNNNIVNTAQPSINDKSQLLPHSTEPYDASVIKQNVVYSVTLLLGGKLLTIQVPFIFKYLIDSITLATSQDEATRNLLITVSDASSPSILQLLADSSSFWNSPLMLVATYGLARTTAVAMLQYRDVVFSHVALPALRRVGRTTFDHIHSSLDLTFHLHKNSGVVSRILDRGNKVRTLKPYNGTCLKFAAFHPYIQIVAS